MTLSDISTGIGVSETFIKDLGLTQTKSSPINQSDSTKKRNWKIYETLYFRLLKHYERVLAVKHQSRIIEEIKGQKIKIIDSTTINLCLSLFDWAKFRTTKGGIKIHTCWNDTLMILDMINISEAKVHERYGLAQLIFPKNTIIV